MTNVSFTADPAYITQLGKDEGEKLCAYQDTLGVWTIGDGHTGPEVHKGLTETHAQAVAQLYTDAVSHAQAVVDKLPWVSDLGEVRRDVLFEMAFQLGAGGLLAFKNTLAMVHSGDYLGASKNMLLSLWASQTPARAQRLSTQMRTGTR